MLPEGEVLHVCNRVGSCYLFVTWRGGVTSMLPGEEVLTICYLEGRFYLDVAGWGGTFHAAGCVDSVAEQAVPRHGHAHNSRHHRPEEEQYTCL